MTSEALTSLEITTKDVLGRAASITSLSDEDRAELDVLARESAQAREKYGPWLDTAAGMRLFVEAMMGFLQRASEILEKYASPDVQHA